MYLIFIDTNEPVTDVMYYVQSGIHAIASANIECI